MTTVSCPGCFFRCAAILSYNYMLCRAIELASVEAEGFSFEKCDDSTLYFELF
jgi:hypothetical protein